MRNFQSNVLLFLITIFYSTFSFSQQFQSNTNNLAIEGYSPVSYFTKHRAEKGIPEFSVTYLSKTYYLSSKEQVQLFQTHPDRYIPQFGDHCTYNLSLGRKVNIDPTSFKIINNLLYLFHKSKKLDALKEWNKQPSEKDLIEKAKGQFSFFKFG